MMEMPHDTDNSNTDYSPWEQAHWCLLEQAVLRKKQPRIAEQLIKSADLVPPELEYLLNQENPYLTHNLALQQQAEEFLPATSLGLKQEALANTLELKEAKAKRIISQRECTQFTYGYSDKGVKMRQGALRGE